MAGNDSGERLVNNAINQAVSRSSSHMLKGVAGFVGYTLFENAVRKLLMENGYVYVEERDGRYYLRGQRVPVYSIAYAWNQGRSPETISQDFPVLTLAEVYGAITFYLDHRALVDQQQAEDTAMYEAARAAQQSTTAAKMAELRQRETST